MTNLPITPANFAAHIAMIMPSVMPMRVVHGTLVENAAIVFGNPSSEKQIPLPEFVDLPFRFGATPQTLIDPKEYLVMPSDASKLPPTKPDFEFGLEMLRMPASKVNFELCSIARYMVDANPGASRDQLIVEALRHEITRPDDPYSLLKIGYFLMCHSSPTLRFQATAQLLLAGRFFSNIYYLSAAAMAYELAAEVCESPGIGLGNKDVERAVGMTMAISRASAGTMWLASLQFDDDPGSLKVRVYRGLYSAWHNSNRSDMAHLLEKAARISQRDGDAIASADIYVRLAWSLCDTQDPAFIRWDGVADSLMAGLRVWQVHPQRRMHADHMIELIEAARANAKR